MGSISPQVVLTPKDRNRILFESLPAALPEVFLPEDTNHMAVASVGVAQLEDLREESFGDIAVWRDLCALTGTFRTFYDRTNVLSAWRKLFQKHQPCAFKPITGTSEIVRVGDRHSWVQVAYTFEGRGTLKTLCSGILALAPDANSQWKIWMFTTLLEQLKGFPSPDSRADTRNGVPKLDIPTELNGIGHEDILQCVVVGAGFSGLAIAGRLNAMGVNVVTLEKSPEVGDNWKNRYESAKFHTTKNFCDFPLSRTFTPEDPTFPRRLDLIRSYKEYVETHGLTIWCSSLLENASYNYDEKTWTLHINRSGEAIAVKARHLVLAIGGLGAVPNIPTIPGRELYKGELLHSYDYRNADQWKSKRGIVIGSANTAHDIGEDMIDAGLSSVTMVQRTATPVFPIEWYKDATDVNYKDDTDLELADRRTTSLPVAVARQMSIAYYLRRMKEDPDKLDRLERAGFGVERSGDMVKCTFGEGAGGHHTDVGGGARIIAGQMKVKQADIANFTPSGLEFTDGSRLDADVIVFCTGFHTNMSLEAMKLVGPKIGSQLDSFWGIDGEGELRGAFRPLKHPGIWFIGGGAPWARFGSRFLALQIHSDLVGHPLPQYMDSQ